MPSLRQSRNNLVFSCQFSVVSGIRILLSENWGLNSKLIKMKSSDFRDLIVWQKSMILAKDIYKLVKRLPREETYVLSDQMRRAVVSVPSNIAEGHGRDSAKEFIRFLSVARGSLRELSTQLELCLLCDYLDKDSVENANSLIIEIDKMLTSLSSKLTTEN